MIQGTYDIVVVSGDTWNGVAIEVKVNGSAVDLTGAAILMEARVNRNMPVVFTAGTLDNTIEITEAVAGKFAILPALVSATPGTYLYDIQITFDDDTVKTYVKGTFLVLADITHG